MLALKFVLAYALVSILYYSVFYLLEVDIKVDLPLSIFSALWPLSMIAVVFVSIAHGLYFFFNNIYKKKFLNGIKNRVASWKWRRKNAKAFKKAV